MSDAPAQPTTGLAHRFVGDPNSAIGALIKRGLTGMSPVVTVESTEPIEKPGNKTGDALDVLERVIDEVETALPAEKMTPESQLAAATAEGVMSQVMPQIMNQTADALDPALSIPANPTSTRKEATEAVGIDQVAVEAARGVQQVELERQMEIPPEVEGYLQQVEDHKDTAPKEVVIADGSQTAPADHQYPAQPVVVLPITAEEEKIGAKKSPKFSIRWLIEWSQRLMKMFTGKVIYRPVSESTPNAA